MRNILRQAAGAVTFFIAFYVIVIVVSLRLEMIDSLDLQPTWWWQLKTGVWTILCSAAALILVTTINGKPVKRDQTA